MILSATYYPKYDRNWHYESIRGKLLNKQFPMCGNYDYSDEIVLIQHLNLCSKIGIKNLFLKIDEDFIDKNVFSMFEKVINQEEINLKLSFFLETDCLCEKVSSFLYSIDSECLFRVKRKKVLLLKEFSDKFKALSGDFYLIGDRIRFSCQNLHTEDLKGLDAITGIDIIPQSKTLLECIKAFDFLYSSVSSELKGKGIDIWPSFYPRINNHLKDESNVSFSIHDDSGHLLQEQLRQFSDYSHCIISSFNNWKNDSQIEPCGNEENYHKSDNFDENMETLITLNNPYRNYCFDLTKIIENFTSSINFNTMEEKISSTRIQLNLPKKREILMTFFYDGFDSVLFKTWNNHVISMIKIENDNIIYFKQGMIKGSIERNLSKITPGREYSLNITDFPGNFKFEINGEEKIHDDLKFITQDTENLILFEDMRQQLVGRVLITDLNKNQKILQYPSQEI